MLSSRGGELTLRLDERETPFGTLGRVASSGRALRGTVRFSPELLGAAPFALDHAGAHTWWPVAPRGRVEVSLSEPGLSFRGTAYHDVNFGAEPLEDAFAGWSWARGATADGGAIVTYASTEVSGASRQLALAFGPSGTRKLDGMVPHALGGSRWGLDLRVDAPEGSAPRVVRALEDGPFYARSVVEARLFGERALMVHESLSCLRWKKAWVRGLASFKTGRAA